MPLQVIRDLKAFSLLAPGLLFLMITRKTQQTKKTQNNKQTATTTKTKPRPPKKLNALLQVLPLHMYSYSQRSQIFSLSILRLACDSALFTALIWNAIQNYCVAACSKASASTFEI